MFKRVAASIIVSAMFAPQTSYATDFYYISPIARQGFRSNGSGGAIFSVSESITNFVSRGGAIARNSGSGLGDPWWSVPIPVPFSSSNSIAYSYVTARNTTTNPSTESAFYMYSIDGLGNLNGAISNRKYGAFSTQEIYVGSLVVPTGGMVIVQISNIILGPINFPLDLEVYSIAYATQ